MRTLGVIAKTEHPTQVQNIFKIYNILWNSGTKINCSKKTSLYLKIQTKQKLHMGPTLTFEDVLNGISSVSHTPTFIN